MKAIYNCLTIYFLLHYSPVAKANTEQKKQPNTAKVSMEFLLYLSEMAQVDGTLVGPLDAPKQVTMSQDKDKQTMMKVPLKHDLNNTNEKEKSDD